MDRRSAYIINAAPGVGKTTLMKNLHARLQGSFALIDGDDVGKVVPYGNSLNWLNMMQDNIADCCANFMRYGYTHCVISFVFPSEDRLNRIKGLLFARGFDTVHIILDCEDDEICRRIVQRNTSKLINPEQTKIINQDLKKLTAALRVDTTAMVPEAVVTTVIEYITGGCAHAMD